MFRFNVDESPNLLFYPRDWYLHRLICCFCSLLTIEPFSRSTSQIHCLFTDSSLHPVTEKNNYLQLKPTWKWYHLEFWPIYFCSTTQISGGSRISRRGWGGVDPLRRGGHGPPMQALRQKLGPVGGACARHAPLDPPMQIITGCWCINFPLRNKESYTILHYNSQVPKFKSRSTSRFTGSW